MYPKLGFTEPPFRVAFQSINTITVNTGIVSCLSISRALHSFITFIKLICLIVVDNGKKGGATEKKWSDEKLVKNDCTSCKMNEDCKETITINVDLGSVSIELKY